MAKQFRKAAVGGTFDHFHKGHQHLLRTAFHHSDSVVIGVTTPALVKSKKLSQIIEPYHNRVLSVTNFLKANGLSEAGSVVALSDPVGYSGTDPDIDVLVVSEQTKAGASLVQSTRHKNGLLEIPVVIASMITDQAGEYISSTRIRQGVIDRDGYVFSHLFNKDLVFKSSLLDHLKQPQGTLHQQMDSLQPLLKKATTLALVGDRATQAFIDNNQHFNVSVIDHHTARKPYQIDWQGHQPEYKISVSNPPGSITHAASQALIKALNLDAALVEVDGEEDLLAFPIILNAPLGSIVIYGQPSQGLVSIEVNEKEKSHFKLLLKKLV